MGVEFMCRSITDPFPCNVGPIHACQIKANYVGLLITCRLNTTDRCCFEAQSADGFRGFGAGCRR